MKNTKKTAEKQVGLMSALQKASKEISACAKILDDQAILVAQSNNFDKENEEVKKLHDYANNYARAMSFIEYYYEMNNTVKTRVTSVLKESNYFTAEQLERLNEGAKDETN